MAVTVEEGFSQFEKSLAPSAEEAETAESRLSAIEACLQRSVGKARLVRVGSYRNETGIREFSNIDYLAVIPIGRLTPNSATTLSLIHEIVRQCSPGNGVRMCPPAVVVAFGEGESQAARVIPAGTAGRHVSGFPLYKIADRNEGWQRACPDAFGHYVASVNAKCGGRVKPLIRFVKAWKVFHNLAIQSFYLEACAARFAASNGTFTYSRGVRDTLQFLIDNELDGIQDPTGISGRIPALLSATDRERALSELVAAFVRSESAVEAEDRGMIAEAFDWWKLVFAGKFTSYG